MQRLLRRQVPAKSHVPFSPRRYSSIIERTLLRTPVINRPQDGNYKKTLGNLKIDETTKVMYQGFTGRHATANAHQSIDYGTNVVGGVSPRKSGAHMGLPLFPTVKEAVKHLKPDATAVFVAAQFAAGAIGEAIEAEIPLVVAVAEHVPIHDVMKIHSILKTQSKTRLVGANCAGIINPITCTRIGFMPHPAFLPGRIGIVAKSGTLSYEAVSSTTRSGLGQSLVIGVGGDWIAGTTLIDGVQVLLEDEATEGIIVIGEIGGNTEIGVAEMVKAWRGKPKPVMGLIGGLTAREGRVMGHAGAVRGVGDVGPREKIRALEDAGVVMVTDPAHFGPGMLKLLGGRQPLQQASVIGLGQTRAYHSLATRPVPPRRILNQNPIYIQQRRALHIQETEATSLLIKHSPIPLLISPEPIPPQEGNSIFSLALTIDRTSGTPCFFVSSLTSEHTGFTLDYSHSTPPPDVAISIAEHITLLEEASEQLTHLLVVLWKIFKETEAYTLNLKSVVVDREGKIIITGSGVDVKGSRNLEFIFDDAAFRSGGRQVKLHELRHIENEIVEEVEAGRAGIAYVKFPGNDANIGTLVNGAGLSMNTCDVIAYHGGHPANFLDTGGKATKDTVKESVRLLLKDQRVKAILVNIFGGLTLCDMIAEGIIIAFEELRVNTPVVVRLRGTNEELGRKMIRESGLPLYPFDDLESAVKRVIALASEHQ